MPKIIQWTIKYSFGFITNEEEASHVLIGMVAIMIFVTLFLLFGGSGDVRFNPEDYPHGLISPEST